MPIAKKQMHYIRIVKRVSPYALVAICLLFVNLKTVSTNIVAAQVDTPAYHIYLPNIIVSVQERVQSEEVTPLDLIYDEHTGAITGRLILMSNGTPQPIVGEPIKLSRKLYSSNPVLVGVDLTAPTSITDEYGRFAFHEVPPGFYAIIHYHPTISSVLGYPDNKYSIIIEVRAGGFVDLRQLTYGSWSWTNPSNIADNNSNP